MDIILTLCTVIGAMIVLGLTVTFVGITVVVAGMAVIEFISDLFKRKGQR